MKDPYFKKVYNQKVLQNLSKRYGPVLYHHLEMSVSTEVMLNMVKKMDKKSPRRGEAVMVIPNLAGQIWLHTKKFYPSGVYRLMTGGLDPGENPEKALIREVFEETGFMAEIDRCLAVVTYELTNGTGQYPFVSFVFLTKPTDGVPTPTDSGETIEDFKAVPVEELFETARQLRQLEGDFADWGRFRAVTHELAAQALLLDHKG
ncbi:MAG: NUDIX hydrolase [Anaerolineaceae bacterium]|nr:NUDIX hydrolase [Anaerolineaceae bacterium]